MTARRTAGAGEAGDFLDLAGKLRHRSVVAAVRQMATADGRRPAAPLVVDLDPTSFCDLACPECISIGTLQSGRFTRARLLALAEEMAAAGVRAVVLIGGGEPLLHKATPELIARLDGLGIAVGLVTNGTRLRSCDPSTLRTLHWLRVSVDAATAATYHLFRPAGGRGRNAFAEVVSGLRFARDAGVRRLGYSFVVMHRASDGGQLDSNSAELPAAADLARSLGCHYLEIKAQMAADHSLPPMAADTLAEVTAAVRAAQQRQARDFQVVLSGSMRALLSGDGTVDQPKAYHTCHVTRLRTLIAPAGAYICGYHRGSARFSIGDLTRQSFREFWDGADLGVVDPSVDCGFYCARHASNLVLQRWIDTAVPDTVDDDDEYFI